MDNGDFSKLDFAFGPSVMSFEVLQEESVPDIQDGEFLLLISHCWFFLLGIPSMLCDRGSAFAILGGER